MGRRFFTRRRIVILLTHFRNHLHKLIHPQPVKFLLVFLEKSEDFREEIGFARQSEAAAGFEPELLLGLIQEVHEDGEVEEPGRDDEPAPLRSDVDGDGSSGRAAAGGARLVGVGGGGGIAEHGAAPAEALGFPAVDDLSQPYDLGDHIHFLDD